MFALSFKDFKMRKHLNLAIYLCLFSLNGCAQRNVIIDHINEMKPNPTANIEFTPKDDGLLICKNSHDESFNLEIAGVYPEMINSMTHIYRTGTTLSDPDHNITGLLNQGQIKIEDKNIDVYSEMISVMPPQIGMIYFYRDNNEFYAFETKSPITPHLENFYACTYGKKS